MTLHRILGRGKTDESWSSAALWSLAGTLVYTGCQWGLLVATVRLMSPADVGALSLGFAISAPVFLFLHLRLRSASATDVTGDFTVRTYIGVRVACTCLAVMMTFAVCMGAKLSLNETAIVMLVAAAKGIESGSDLLYGFSQKCNDMRIVSISMIGRGLLALTAFTLLLLYTHSLRYALGGLCLAWGIILLLVDIPYTRAVLRARSVGRSRDLKALPGMVPLVLATLPLGMAAMLMSLSSNMPRYFIQRYVGAADLGVFAAIGYLAMAASVVVTALAEATIARIAQALSRGDVAEAKAMLNKVVGLTLLLSVSGVVLSVSLGKYAITLLYGSAYIAAYGLLVWMMIAAGVANLASVYGFVLVAAKRYSEYLYCLVSLTVCMGVACVTLIPRWGTHGAVLACCAGYSVQFAMSYQMTRTMFARYTRQFRQDTTLQQVQA